MFLLENIYSNYLCSLYVPSIHISICFKILIFFENIKKCMFLNLNVKLTPQSLVFSWRPFWRELWMFCSAESWTTRHTSPDRPTVFLCVLISLNPWPDLDHFDKCVIMNYNVVLLACSVYHSCRDRGNSEKTKRKIFLKSGHRLLCFINPEACLKKNRDDYLVNGVPDIIKIVPIIYIFYFILKVLLVHFVPILWVCQWFAFFAWLICLHICVWVFLCNWIIYNCFKKVC